MPIGDPACPTVVRPVRIGNLAGDEVGAARRAARLGVVVGEAHALGRQAVEVRRPAGHDALVVRADIGPADVVAHDHDDVGLLARRLRERGRRRQQGDSNCSQACQEVFQVNHALAPIILEFLVGKRRKGNGHGAVSFDLGWGMLRILACHAAAWHCVVQTLGSCWKLVFGPGRWDADKTLYIQHQPFRRRHHTRADDAHHRS